MATEKPLKHNKDDTLNYTSEAVQALLGKMIERTKGDAKKTEIISADQVVRAGGAGVVDPYLSNIVEGEAETTVNPLQYSSLNPKFSEHTNLEELNEALRGYKKSEKSPEFRDLVTFKPERMALHWVSILTTMYVKTNVTLHDRTNNGNGTDVSNGSDYAKWGDDRDANYVGQVNALYFKLFGKDRTYKKEFTADSSWGDGEARMQEINGKCAKVRSKVYSDVNMVRDALKSNQKIQTGLFTEEEENKLRDVFASNDDDASQAIALKWCKEEIYRERANHAIAGLMEKWFAELVFAKGSGYEKKSFVPKIERETFVLSGGSATGKSMPMSLLVQKLAKGYDPESALEWKKNGLDLNNAVHIKSEVMRSLLLEEDFLTHGNRLFMDESAHDERAIIRDQLFKYLDRMLKGEASPALIDQKEAPILIHDRRSMSKDHLRVLTQGDPKIEQKSARLNMYYFNLNAEDALKRNQGRGASDLGKLEKGGINDIDHYAPRFVNARSNIGSQEKSARRILEMIETEVDKDILVPLYSTEVDQGNRPYVIGYADLKNRTIHIRRLTRLLDIIDNTHFIPPLPDKEKFNETPLDGMVKMPEKLDDLLKRHTKHYADKPYESKPMTRDQREHKNAKLAAQWLSHLAKDLKYTVYLSTPHIEKRTKVRDTVYAEIHPPVAGTDGPPRLFTLRPDVFDALGNPKLPYSSIPLVGENISQVRQYLEETLLRPLNEFTKHFWSIDDDPNQKAKGQTGKFVLMERDKDMAGASADSPDPSRYKDFLEQLESSTAKTLLPPGTDATERLKPTLFAPERNEYIPSHGFVAALDKKRASQNLDPQVGE